MISHADLDFLLQDNIWPYLLIKDTEELQYVLTSGQVPQAIQYGKTAAKKVRGQFPNHSVEEILTKFHVKVSYSDEPEKVFNRYRRATYEKHPPEVTVYQKSIKQLENLAVAYQIEELSSRQMILGVMLAHELYHHLQTQLLPQIKQQYRRVWRQLGPFKLYRFIKPLNEITAHVFSRELYQIKISPFILDLLTIQRSEEQLSNLLNKAIELSKITLKTEEMYPNETL